MMREAGGTAAVRKAQTLLLSTDSCQSFHLLPGKLNSYIIRSQAALYVSLAHPALSSRLSRVLPLSQKITKIPQICIFLIQEREAMAEGEQEKRRCDEEEDEDDEGRSGPFHSQLRQKKQQQPLYRDKKEMTKRCRAAGGGNKTLQRVMLSCSNIFRCF